MTNRYLLLSLLLLEGSSSILSLHPSSPPQTSRRSWFQNVVPSYAASSVTLGTIFNSLLIGGTMVSTAEAAGDDLVFATAASGIQWADSKVGTGPTKTKGEPAAIDYVMSTTGARYGAKIYSTVEKNAPYRWILGDGTTIQGLEEAIIGGDGISPMRAGGVRRLILPSSLAYATLAQPTSGRTTGEECQSGIGVGPIPPASEAFEEFQRFKNIYCNPNRVYQPDLVIDVKLYGKRN